MLMLNDVNSQPNIHGEITENVKSFKYLSQSKRKYQEKKFCQDMHKQVKHEVF